MNELLGAFVAVMSAGFVSFLIVMMIDPYE